MKNGLQDCQEKFNQLQKAEAERKKAQKSGKTESEKKKEEKNLKLTGCEAVAMLETLRAKYPQLYIDSAKNVLFYLARSANDYLTQNLERVRKSNVNYCRNNFLALKKLTGPEKDYQDISQIMRTEIQQLLQDLAKKIKDVEGFSGKTIFIEDESCFEKEIDAGLAHALSNDKFTLPNLSTYGDNYLVEIYQSMFGPDIFDPGM